MASKQSTKCFHCQQRLRISESKIGLKVRCPACRKHFIAASITKQVEDSDDVSQSVVSIDTSEVSKQAMLQGIVSPVSQNAAEPTLHKIGRFELKAILGVGGFGKVYRAFDPQLERFVALKVPMFGPNQKKRITRFLNEAKAAARLKHAYIVSTLESGKADKRYYIATEFIQGELLSKKLKSSPPGVQESIEIICKLAEALAYAHSQGIIHRDLKPHNVIIDQDNNPQLMDFGLAKRLDDDSNFTCDGAVLGTPAYMAPEQARGELSKVNALSDQYSLGVVLYHMLTGGTPYSGSTHMLIAEVAKGEFHALRDVDPDIDSDLDAICQKAMAPDPADRYESCQEFHDDLRSWLDGRPVVARPLSRLELVYRATQKHKVMVATSLAFMLTCCIIAALSIILMRQSFFPEIPSPDNLTQPVTEEVIEVASEKTSEPELQDNLLENSDVPPSATTVSSVNQEEVRESQGDMTSGHPLQNATNIESSSLLYQWPKDQPPPAIAPFNAEQAKQHQKEWAQYLGVPVKYTNSIGMKLVLIPPGEYERGASEEEIEMLVANTTNKHLHQVFSGEGPRHHVVISRPFFFGVYEVTQNEYRTITGANPSKLSNQDTEPTTTAGVTTEDFPVDSVSWHDAHDFCRQLSEQEQVTMSAVPPDAATVPVNASGYRLPTEAEWEYACRAGTITRYYNGKAISDLLMAGWLNINAAGRTHPVGRLIPNQFGLYDTLGNVTEWCLDRADNQAYKTYLGQLVVNPKYPYLEEGTLVHRGGHFFSSAMATRVSFRDNWVPQGKSSKHGFRVVLPVDNVRNSNGNLAVKNHLNHTGTEKKGSMSDSPHSKVQYEGTLTGEVDLLSLVNIDDCTVSGDVWRSGNQLVLNESSGGSASILEIPVRFPDFYRVTIDVSRPSDSGVLKVHIPLGRRGVSIIFDGEYGSGLRYIDGVDYNGNSAFVTGQRQFVDKQPHQITIDVSHEHLAIAFDDREFIEFKGAFERLHSERTGKYGVDPGNTHSLCLQVNNGAFSIQEIKLDTKSGVANQQLPARIVSDAAKQAAIKIHGPSLKSLFEKLDPNLNSLHTGTSPSGRQMLRIDRNSVNPMKSGLMKEIVQLKGPVGLNIFGMRVSSPEQISIDYFDDLAAMPNLLEFDFGLQKWIDATANQSLSNSNSLECLVTQLGGVEETQELSRISTLRVLRLYHSNLDDEQITMILKGLPKLKLLYARDGVFQPQALEHLSSTPKLETLVLSNNDKLDDSAIEHISKLKSLEKLEIKDTRITANGVDRLRKALPQCRIEWDGGTVEPGNVQSD